MKEICNLAIKNNYFRELNYKSLINDMKKKELLLQMFMVMKRNRELKSHGVANRSLQHIYTNKNEYSLSTSDFYTLKYACVVAAKE